MLFTPYEYESAVRLTISTLIGLIIGYIRRGQPAGMRTIALICIGSTLFTLIALNPMFPVTESARIVAQIVTGIGFIGAGVIWKTGHQIGGLTSAASIWIIAAIGTTIGLGQWFLTAVTTVLAIIILYSKHYLKQKLVEE